MVFIARIKTPNEIMSKHTDQIITEKSYLGSDLGLSSFDVVEVVCELEDAFNIEISDQDIRKFVSVAEIIEYLLVRKS